MGAIVIEREARHETVHAQNALEAADNGNRPPGANENRLAPPFFGQSSGRLGNERIALRKLNGARRTAGRIEAGPAILWDAVLDEAAKRSLHRFGVLIADQAEGELGGGLRGNDGLAARSRVAPDNAVHLAG